VSGSFDKTIRIWEMNNGVCVRSLRGHGGGVLTVTVVDNVLVSGSLDGEIKVWDFSSGLSYATLKNGSVQCVDASGDVLVNLCQDGAISIWKAGGN